MKQKVLFTTFLFFLPVLQRFISAKPIYLAIANLKYEVMIILGIVVLLFMIRMGTVIYFWVSIIKWISSGFKLKKLIPCIISFAAIFCIDYSINAIINNSIKSIKNRIQRLPNVFIKRNTQMLQSSPLQQSTIKN
jgi:hypothetical protein